MGARRPSTPRGGTCAALGFLLLFSIPRATAQDGRRGRTVPDVETTQREEQDPDVRREPEKKDLLTLAKHLADLITDKNTRTERVEGVDFFLDRLQAVLNKNGTDLPRYKILLNAKDGRDALRDGYDDLRKALPELLEARERLLEVYAETDAILELNDGFVEKTLAAADADKRTSGAMRPDSEPPESPGQEVDASPLHAIEPLGPRLEPLDPELEKIGKKIAQADRYIAGAKQRVTMVRLFAQNAKDLDDRTEERLAERRTRRGKDSITREDSSHHVLKNANEWLERAAKQAEKVSELLRELTTPKRGLKLAVEDAVAADGKTQKGKAAGIPAAAQVNSSHIEISRDIREEWEKMEQMPEGEEKERKKAALKERAREAESRAKEAAKSADESAAKAVEAAKKARDSQSEAEDLLKKLQEKLGKGSKDELSELPEYMIYVHAPRPGKGPSSGQGAGARTRSKPLKYPRVLDAPAGEVIDQYGEKRYGINRR